MSDNDYNTLRRRNIAERNAIFAEFFKDVKRLTAEESDSQKACRGNDDAENEPPRKRRRVISSKNDAFGCANVSLAFRKRYHTRSRTRRSTSDTSYDSDNYENGDELKSDTKRKKDFVIIKSEYDPNSIPSVDEITQEMLSNVAKASTLKKYCKTNGTSCHQCRQKTLDTKTVCRSGECIGVRGHFCGPCLRGRYGENAIEALQDPNWVCPPCRGLCNCSICRAKNGLRPTGILAPVAQGKGYSSVMEYLRSNENDA